MSVQARVAFVPLWRLASPSSSGYTPSHGEGSIARGDARDEPAREYEDNTLCAGTRVLPFPWYPAERKPKSRQKRQWPLSRARSSRLTGDATTRICGKNGNTLAFVPVHLPWAEGIARDCGKNGNALRCPGAILSPQPRSHHSHLRQKRQYLLLPRILLAYVRKRVHLVRRRAAECRAIRFERLRRARGGVNRRLPVEVVLYLCWHTGCCPCIDVPTPPGPGQA